MNNLTFTAMGWGDYLYWQAQDKKTLQKINSLLKEIQRTPFSGTGKPEALKRREGCWSRRIDEKNRLVYLVGEDKDVTVVSCKGHYAD